jgi:hypothetical protein
MKIRIALCSAVLAAIATPVVAQVVYDPAVAPAAPYPSETIYVPAVRPSGAVHGGYVAYEDEKLLSDAVGALSSDRRMNGSTVTLVAKNGELIMNGTANDVAQASRMERIAKQVSGGRVTAWFDQPGA